MQNRIVKDYGLRFDVTHSYSLKADQRGGQTFKPLYKKDLKPFKLMVKCAVNRSKRILEIVEQRGGQTILTEN